MLFIIADRGERKWTRRVPVAVLVARGFGQSLAVKPPHRPFIFRYRAARAIEFVRRMVPVEHRPFHPRPSALDHQLCHPLEQRSADTTAAKTLGHEEVLQIKSRMASPGAVAAKEE